MRRLHENDEHRGAKRQQPQHQERDSSYSDFLATQPPVFADATDPLEADSWLSTKESKCRLLHCTEYQKTLYVAQQLRGLVRAWWLPTSPPYLLITMFHGTSYVLLSTHITNIGHTMSTRMRRKLTSTVKGLPSTCKSAWVFHPTSPIMNWQVPSLIKRG
jgi:hypothetical protein